MPLFDATLLFYHAGTSFNLTSGEYVSLVGNTASSASGVINLGNARDLGIGQGEEIPQVVVSVGTAITSSSASMTINLQFQGSTDSVNWTTYLETGANSTASWAAGGAYVFDVPRRSPGAALPLYYRLNTLIGGTGTTTTAVSTGTIFAGIVLSASENAGTMAQYPSGFSVA